MKLLLAFVCLMLQAARPGDILGTWRGTSICADPAHDTACKNEDVIYQVDSLMIPAGPVRMSADKIVNGIRQPMGVFWLRYDSTTHVWSAEFRARFNARWSFEPKGDRMTGTLVELPSGRVVRRVTTSRQP